MTFLLVSQTDYTFCCPANSVIAQKENFTSLYTSQLQNIAQA